jgi:hypothetical protein
LLNIVSLDYVLDQWFRKKKEQTADGGSVEAKPTAADKAKARP